jgi:hypothetical protein
VDLSASTNGGAVMFDRSPEIVAIDYRAIRLESKYPKS